MSFFEPADLAALLALPSEASPVALLCLGHVDEFYPRPMLELSGWESLRDLDDLVFENRWPEGDSLA